MNIKYISNMIYIYPTIIDLRIYKKNNNITHLLEGNKWVHYVGQNIRETHDVVAAMLLTYTMHP